MIVWTIEAAQGASTPDRIVVSSEDSEIREIAEQAGADVPFVRPAYLAEDDTPGVEPILHAARELPDYDVILVLQPTSPLRSPADIDACSALVLEGTASSVASVQRVEKPPQWIYEFCGDGSLRPYLDGDTIHTRQAVSDLYRLNGAVYVLRRDVLLEAHSLIPEGCRGYVMPRERSVDIDTELDLAFAEFLLRRSDSRMFVSE